MRRQKTYDDTLAAAGERFHAAGVIFFKECAEAFGLVRALEWLTGINVLAAAGYGKSPQRISKRDPLDDAILNAISEHTIFSQKDIEDLYAYVNSYDKTVLVARFAPERNVDLMSAVRMLRLKKLDKQC